MNATVVSKSASRPRAKKRPSFETVLVYENLVCGERAWNFYEKLTRRFDGDFEFSHLMWSFSMLGDPQTLRLAARSSAYAHLVILSFTGNAELPVNVKDWVERWVSLSDSRDSALVTLTDHEVKARTSAATHAYLRRIVETHKIDFFPHCLSAPRKIHPE